MNKKKTQIVQFGPRRTMSDINQSINKLEAKILDLQAGTYSLTVATAANVPDILVSVLEDKVYARFLAHRESVKNLSEILGVKLIEYLESALFDTYEQISTLQNESGKMAQGVIEHISTVSKTLLDQKPGVSIQENPLPKKNKSKASKKEEPILGKLKLEPGVQTVFYRDNTSTQILSEHRVFLQLRNKSSTEEVVKITVYKKNVDNLLIKVDSFERDVACGRKGFMQFLIRSDNQLTITPASDALRAKVLRVEKEPNTH